MTAGVRTVPGPALRWAAVLAWILLVDPRVPRADTTSHAACPPPPASIADADAGADVHVRSVEEDADGTRRAFVQLRGGLKLELAVGDVVGVGVVREIRLDDAVVLIREPLADRRLLKPWRDLELVQLSLVPADRLGGRGAEAEPCPRALVRVAGDVAVFSTGVPSSAASFVRLRAGDEICGGWVVDRLSVVERDLESRGVAILRESTTGRRLALGAWRR